MQHRPVAACQLKTIILIAIPTCPKPAYVTAISYEQYSFLIPQQASSFFSARLASKKQLDVAEKQSEDEDFEAVAIEELLPKIQTGRRRDKIPASDNVRCT